MLATAKIPGRRKPVELAAIKDGEKYEKRPSVRASKKAREKEGISL